MDLGLTGKVALVRVAAAASGWRPHWLWRGRGARCRSALATRPDSTRRWRGCEHSAGRLSLNWINGCPLDCGLAVRSSSRTTPVQLLNRATDPMLPPVKPHTFAMLRMLDSAGYRNDVLGNHPRAGPRG